MGTKNNPGAFDCYASAEPDEPVFVLLGRDPMAPLLVTIWAHMRRRDGEDDLKCEEALNCSAAMFRWALGQGKGHRVVQAAELLVQVLNDFGSRVEPAP